MTFLQLYADLYIVQNFPVKSGVQVWLESSLRSKYISLHCHVEIKFEAGAEIIIRKIKLPYG